MSSSDTFDPVDEDTLKLYPERRGGEVKSKWSDIFWNYRGHKNEIFHCEHMIYKCIQKRMLTSFLLIHF
jgi:hypothetical protein